MIDSISGVLVEKSPARVVIDIGGIALACLVSLSTVEELPAPGAKVKLWTHLLVRDEQIELFGFATLEERWLFLNLLPVSGVGPRLALTILSGARTDDIRRAVAQEDTDRLQAIPRVGEKLARRLVLELRGRIAEGLPVAVGEVPQDGGVREAIQGLLALGFARTQAEKAVRDALRAGVKGTEEIVKHALRVS
jgi:Holliday junction DNA helicase RuvA